MDVSGLKIERGAGRRRTSAARSPWFGRGVGLLVAGGAVALFWGPLNRWLDRVRLPEVQVLQVTESHPAAAAAARGTAANGHIVAARRAALSADTPGRIVELNVTEGSVVRRGDVVARLYAAEYAASLRRAEAELGTAAVEVERAAAEVAQAEADHRQEERSAEAAEQAVAEAEAAAALAEIEHRRAATLRESGVGEQRALDSAKAALDRDTARLSAARARRAAADAQVGLAAARIATAQARQRSAEAVVDERRAARDLAQATLDKTEVRAPFDGIVVLKDAEVGEVVSPNSQGGSNARGSVCTMVDLDSLEAQAEVPETSVAGVAVGGEATIYLDAYPDTPYRGRVDRIWPTANRQKATIEVRIALLDKDDRLRPEMGVRVVFSSTPADEEAGVAEASGAREPAAGGPAILVPQSAVVQVDGTDGVFTLERDVVAFAAVRLGSRRGNQVAIRDGLRPGQRVVIEPPLDLQPGDRVRIAGGS